MPKHKYTVSLVITTDLPVTKKALAVHLRDALENLTQPPVNVPASITKVTVRSIDFD